MRPFAAVEGILNQAIAEQATPAAAIEVGRADGSIWHAAFGALTYDAAAPAATVDTVFDLASLTKVIATTTLAMRAVDDETIALDEPIAGRLPRWTGHDRRDVTIADLLSHSSGLTAYLPFYRDLSGRAEFEPAICALPLEYAPRSASIYSDLGFMLLGFILEDAYRGTPGFEGAPGAADPSRCLASQFRSVASYVTPEPFAFGPPRAWRAFTAPTEIDPWRGRLLVGEVHDENCWSLGGAAGHAGVFGSVKALGGFARAALRTTAGEPVLARTATMRRFLQRTNVPGSSRALGWDTMLPTSSCGTRLNATAIGHTGFTGPSLWIDWERDLYVALVANRVHPTRDNDRFRGVRPRVHDAVVLELEGGA